MLMKVVVSSYNTDFPKGQFSYKTHKVNTGNGINKSTSLYLTGNSLLSPHIGKGKKKKPSVVEELMSDKYSTCKNSKTNMEETSTCLKYNKPSDEFTANLLICSKEKNVDHPASMLYTGSCLNAKSKVQLL